MPDTFEDQQWVRLGVAAALTKEYEGDQRAFLSMLAETLSKLLPNEVEVQYEGWFSKKHIKTLNVLLGDFAYAIEDTGRGPLAAYRKKVVRGIALKTETIPMDQCLKEISDAIEQKAAESAQSRAAIANLLGLS